MQVVEPIVRRFDPELVIVAAGFDAANGDPLGGMRLSPAGTLHFWFHVVCVLNINNDIYIFIYIHMCKWKI